MNDQLTPNKPGTFSELNQPKRVNLLVEAKAAEQVVMRHIRNPKTSSLDLASLVRSFVALVDCIQRLRGIPTPGQYRPELSPQKLVAQLKKLKARQPIELLSEATFHDEPGDDESAPENLKAEPEAKESLLQPGEGDRQTGGGGAEQEGGSL